MVKRTNLDIMSADELLINTILHDFLFGEGNGLRRGMTDEGIRHVYYMYMNMQGASNYDIEQGAPAVVEAFRQRNERNEAYLPYIDKLLTEQHNNTVHDIIDAISAKAVSNGDIYNKMAGYVVDLIKNIKQRRP